MSERCLKGITVQSSQLGGVLQPILKNAIKHSAEADSRQTAIFLCKNLSRYPIVHGSKRTLLYSGAFGLYVPPEAFLTFKLRAQYSILKA